MVDPKVQAELRARYNPDGSPLRRHQLKMLDILKYVDKVCRENDIPYWLSSGTCLGAIRHGGFVPWDDDVDIEMFGKDYDRFIRIMEHLPDCPYALQTHKTDPAFLYQFAKIRDIHSELKENTLAADRDFKYRGIFIDVFCLDPSPGRRVAVLGEYLLRLCLAANKIDRPVVRKACRSVCYFFAFRLTAPLVKGMARLRKTGTLRHRFGSLFHKERIAADILPLQKILFEGYEFPVPRNTDAYLKRMFGDYMELPQEKESHIADFG